jgi:hypothetical protein
MSVTAASFGDWFSLHWKDMLTYTGLILLGWFVVTKLGKPVWRKIEETIVFNSVNDRLAEFEKNQREVTKTLNEIIEGLKMMNPEFKAKVEDRRQRETGGTTD